MELSRASRRSEGELTPVWLQQRRGDYLGKTVQVIPHVTDAIQDWVERVAQVPVDESGQAPEVCIIEVCR